MGAELRSPLSSAWVTKQCHLPQSLSLPHAPGGGTLKLQPSVRYAVCTDCRMAFEGCVTLARALLTFHLLRPACAVMVGMDKKPPLSKDPALTLAIRPLALRILSPTPFQRPSLLLETTSREKQALQLLRLLRASRARSYLTFGNFLNNV